MTKRESINDFLNAKKFAMVGVSTNKNKFGYVIFKELREKGFEICPIHRTATEIDGVKCYKSVDEIPSDFEKLYLLTQKTQTNEILTQASRKGLKHIWVQQMSHTAETEKIAKENNVNLIHKSCIFMFANPVHIHKFHRNIMSFFGKLPK
ncbi:MAG TPA: hypothetical protein DDX39_05240 [Bacteroidales bacterium]|nr:MAG: hypothetical protein A2W98_10940 [Bacteroidetes bacterium GWF2_33_38]OFY76585.1 MAG: hypothetical protein A2265_11115 [Bacteroidetes bacterium RIFOXYA12_FULL_33_9]HBF88030.1 hypothetical protein [Bacteroidales bacterium]